MSQALVDAIGTNNFSGVQVDKKDVALLKFVKLLTLNPAETKDADVQALREAGWTDEQIWEASFEVSLFSFVNRMADAYGLDYPKSGWYPPALREKMEREKSEKENRDDDKAQEERASKEKSPESPPPPSE